MAHTISDFVIQRMLDWGVSRIFGFPGDGLGAFDGAPGRANRADLPISYIRPTHEEICALMATAHAKFTGEVGVCTATSSPGAFHMLNGLYDAQMDNQPVVAIVGQQGLNAFGTGVQLGAHLQRRGSLRTDYRHADAGASGHRSRLPCEAAVGEVGCFFHQVTGL